MEVLLKAPTSCRNAERLYILVRLVMMAEGTHSFPYRTRPLSPPAPMVLAPKGAGRVGRCQAVSQETNKGSSAKGVHVLCTTHTLEHPVRRNLTACGQQKAAELIFVL